MSRKLRRHLGEHFVRTSAEMGWGALSNGRLISVAETEGFDVLLTGDQNIYYQQNNKARKIALIVLNEIHSPSVEAQAYRVALAIGAAVPGSFTLVEIDSIRRKRARSSV